MEVLSDILDGMRATGSVYFCDFLVPPWELPYRDEDRAMFHLLRRGRCQLEIAGGTHDLEPGDFVFLAPRVDHSLSSDDPDSPQTLLLCGYCRFDSIENDVLLRALPDYVLMRRDELEQWPWLSRTLEHLSAEYMSGAPGSELTVNKLTEVLLVQLLRADFGRRSDVGIVAALEDKRIARALTAIHADPGRHWTIEGAAKVASMSRSGFARRFKDLLELSFFDYLTRLRMRSARTLLTTSKIPVDMIAERVGYRSDLSFVKVFKKLHGETPRAYRNRC
ncbi:MAG: AraC family transcriptional regulator [Proteobacteria bacterium]|nr:AraC family transcriptional regulator [Pseudomonadota bacterium]MDA1063833.1 AraC family transcriptional regulator [Pseudomonadota bacterium]